MAVLASSAYFTTAEAGCMHAGVSPTIYTDFGQNMARYSVYQVNELLTAITARDGILIPYTTGAEPGKLEHKMISFEGMNNDGAFTAVGYNYTATVAHNGCPNPSFTPRYIGDNQAIHYQGVEYRSSENKAFLLQPGIDYKVTRSSKIFTDITASGVFDTRQYLRDGGSVLDLVHYRAGAGSQEVADFDGHTHGVAGGYAYITGGVVATLGFNYANDSYDYNTDYAPGTGPRDGRGILDDPYTISVHGIQDYGPGGVGQPTADNPKVYLLPFVSRGGDSGSPVWAWDAVDEEYKLISCHQARGGDNSYSRGASQWTIETMESFNQYVDMDAAGHTVHMFGAEVVDGRSKTISDSTNKVETTTQFGHITGGEGFETVYFCGVGSNLTTQETVYTWLSLYDLKDTQNWYSYGNTYFNANGNGSGKQMHLGDLFNTENIVFKSAGSTDNHIYLDQDVDTGIGYVQFTPAEAGQTAQFYLESNGQTDGRDYMLNSAGYIVDRGAELHIKVTNTQEDANGNAYFREWRKQGAGDMYLEGQGNNEVFLNLGGKGTTYLHETGGYAAYNVLINNGATVNFNGDTKQIARDVTFGNGGGFLEFSGLQEFTWESGENTHVGDDGFTINALTQDATLINSTGSTTLRYVTPGNTTFLGSFQDTASSNLNVIYEGGGTWTLNSIHTKLHDGSKFTVASGTAVLAGTNTVHALGSIEGKANTRYSHPDDWHYADSTMNVEVQGGATFRLGSHARLTGDVTVQDGGTLEMAEGVKHRYEYIEGWLIAEDTYDPFYREYYGLKGDVTLNGDSTLRFNYSSGTDAENVYGYNIIGSGNVDMQLGGSGATLVLSGTNSFSGTKTLSGGGLVAEKAASLGDTGANKWLVNKDAFIAVKGIDGNTALTHIATGSTGAIALTQDQTEQVHLSGNGYDNMFVGALAGQVVQYGVAPVTSGSRIVYTKDALETVTLNGNKYWQLGGGGGELVVNFLLDDPNSQLVLGNEYTTGTVTLTNAWNRIGSIFFAGKVTLNYTSEEALGGSKINLDYTNRVAGSPSVVRLLTRHSSGAMMLDGMETADVDMFEHKELFLGSEGYVDYTGTITPDGGAYRFGGITGTLVLRKALKDQEGDEQTNLIVDAQTYSGGTLALAAQASITGDVSVMGYDATRPGVSGGDIALRLDANNAIASAHSVTLKEGGILDVNGTSQTLHRFNMEAGSLLTDTSANWNGSVTLEVEDGATSELRGGVEVNTLVKDGAGSLLLAGDNAYGTLLINNGTVNLLNGNSMSASGVTMVEANGILNLAGGFDVTGSVAFAGGKAMVAGKTLNGSISVAVGKDGTLEQEGTRVSTRINSSVEVAEGSTLNLKGDNGTFVLTATDINESGGTIALDGHYLTINRGGEDPVNVGGTISLKGYASGSDRATLYSDGSTDNMTRNVNHLHIAGGKAAIEEASWNTIWNILSLTGEGDLLWNSHTSHWYSSQLYLDGANTYAGKFTAQRTNGGSSDRKYQAYVELSHDLAAQNMDVDIKGQNDNNYMSLAINTDNATMKSLSGNQYAVLYAGVANPGTDQKHEQAGEKPLNEQPVSTRSATLTITGTGNHTFSGNVTGQDRYIGYETKEDGSQVQVADVADAGISIVMDGQGKQTFNGQHIRFNSVTVNSGVLELDSADLTIKENVTITRGAELQLSQAYALDSGKTLTVLANDPGTTAMLSGGLTLNGGTLTFSAEGLSDSAPALSIGSLSGGSVTLNFTETHAFTSDVQYHLADQDWSNVVVTDATEGLTYLTAAYETDANGLYVSFTTKEGNLIWGGTDGEHDWSSRTFGPSGQVPTSNQTAVFNDAAPNHHVNITNDVKVEGLVFDAAGDYELASDNGSIVTAGNVVQSGSGITTLTEAVRVGSDQSRGTVTVTGGELRVTDDAVLQNVETITGGGTLGVDFGEGNRGTVDALFAPGSSVGSLHVVSGTFEAYWTPCYAGLLLDAGAGYTVGAEQTLAYVQAGQGEGGSPSTLNLGNRTLTAAMVVMQGDLDISGSGGELHADITGGHTITTSGTVTLRGSNFDGNLHVQSGTLNLFEGANTHVAGITMDAGTTLFLGISTGLEGGATIHMGNNASLRMENGAGGSHTVNAHIVMDGSYASLYGTLNGNSTVVRGSIAGHGTLSLKAQSSFWNNSWSIESLLQDGEAGALALSSDGNVTLSAANTYSGGTTITGNRLTTNNERALGTGTLNMTAGELVLKKDLTVGGLSGSENASINLGTKRLTVDSDGNTRFSGEISNGSLAKLGSGTLEIEVGGELDNISVGGGTLALGDCAVTGNLSVAAGTTLDFTGDMLRLSHAVDNAGTFRFRTSGTSIEIENGSGFDIHTDGYLDVNGNKAENGFAQGLTIQVFENTGDGQIVGIAPEVAYMGDTLTLDLATGVASRGGSNSAYTVRMGTVVYDDAFAAAPGAKAVESFNLASANPFAPATLQLSRNLDAGVRITVSGNGGNISLDRGVVLSSGDVDIMALSYTTLYGAGTLALERGAVAMPNQMGIAGKDEWTGTVRISNTSFSGTDITGLANRTSRVEMYGITGGYLKQWQGSLDTNIRLTDTESGDYAWKWTDGQSTGASTITFTGTWDGSGSFVVGGKNQNFTFKGDISTWNGRYVQVGNSSDVTFARTGGQQVVSADFERQNGTLNLIVGNGSAATDAVFNGSLLDVSSLQVKAASFATLAGAHNTLGSLTVASNATLTNTGSTVLTGDLANSGTIVNSGELDLGGTVSAASVGSITNSGTLTIGTKLTSGTIDNSGTIIISSLMQGTAEGYVDALGSTTSGSGFATTTLTVRESGAIINNDGGKILYGGQDVTEAVLGSGIISSATNYGTYFINATNNNVDFNKIYTKSNGALEYIRFANGTELAVNNSGNVHLHTSQVSAAGTATLNMASGATLVVDASTAATVKSTSGSTFTLELAAVSPETRLTLGTFAPNGAAVNVTGSGVLDIGGDAYNISTLNINGGTVRTTHSGNGGFSQHNTVNINAGGTLQLNNVDCLGWGGSGTATINLLGSEEAHAVLELGGRQTYQTTVINMKGNAEVRAMGYTATDHQRPMIDPYGSQQTINASGTNNLIAVPLRMRNSLKLQVEANSELTLAGGTYSDNTGNTITKAGEGKLIFDALQVNYGRHNYTGTLAINEGSVEVVADASFNKVTSSKALDIVAGTTTITTYTGSNGATLAVGSGAGLAINGNSTLASAITNNGTAAFGSGITLTLGGDFEHQGAVYRDIATGDISANGNGLMSNGYVTVLNGGGNVVLNGNVTVSYDSKNYTLQTDGRAYLGSDATTYHARSGEAIYNSAVAAESSIKTVALSNSATLDMQAALAEGVEITSAGGTVKIGESVLLSNNELTATSGSTKLAGSGTYALDLAGGATLGSNVSLDSSWSGIVRLSGAASDTVVLNSIASLGDNKYATLEMAGAIAGLATGDINAPIVLTSLQEGGAALTVNNSGSFTFKGAISGSGNMVNTASSTYTFSGADLSDWSGSLVNNGTLNVNISGMESGGTMGAALVRVNSVSYTGTANSTYTVASLEIHDDGTTLTGTNGTLVVGSLTGNGALTISGSVELVGGEYTGNSITVSADASLHFNGVQAQNAVLASSGTVSLEAEHVAVAGVTGSGSIEAEGAGSHTLEIQGNGEHTSSAAIGSGVDLVMSGTGTQTFNGDLTDFNGAVDVFSGKLVLGQGAKVGALTLHGGEIELSRGGSIGGVRVASGVAAQITTSQDGAVALKQAILNSGALTLNGIIDISALEMQTRDNGYIAVDNVRTDGGSGFATVQSAVEVVRNVVEGSLDVTHARVRYNGQEVALSADGWARFNSGADTNYDQYYLRDNLIEDFSVTRIQDAAAAGQATLNKIVFDNMETAANLVVDTDTSLSLYQVAEDCTANLTLTEDGSIDQPGGYRGVDGFVKLAGNGTYYLHDTSLLGKGVSLSDGWQGTVELNGTGNALDLARRGGLWAGVDAASSSTVRLNGWASSLTDTGWSTDAHVELSGDGLTVQGSALTGETAPVYAFNGNVSGAGSITNARGGAATFTFADVEGWSGSFIGAAGESTLNFNTDSVGASIVADGGKVIARFDGSADAEMSGSIGKQGNSSLDVALQDGFVSFTGEADVSTLFLNEGSTAIISSDFSVENITGTGYVMVYDGNLTVTKGIESLAATITNVGTVEFSSPDTVINLLDDGIFDEMASAYRDIEGHSSATGNGFRFGGGVQMISNGEVGVIKGADNVTVNYKGTAYQLLGTGELYNPADSHTYYIHQGTVAYSTVKDEADLVGLHLDSTLVQGGNPILNLDANLASTVTNGIVSDGGTVSIAQGVTLAAASLHARGDTKLTGQGTYDLGSGVTAFAEHVSLAGDWNGIVRISDAHMSPFTFSNYANNHSSVEVLGISGWWNTGVRDFNGKLILGKDDDHPEKVALKLTDASSNYTYSLNGGVSGEGDYMLAYDSGKRISATTHTIKGDVSNWTGSFIDAVAQTNTAHTATLHFENNTKDANGIVNIAANVIDQRSGREDHKFNVEVVANQGSVHMTGGIEGIDKLTFDPSSNGRSLTIDSLKTNDDNGTTLEFKDSGVAGTIAVNSLSGSGTLTLHNNNKSSGLANFAINGGDYTGESIVFNAMKAGYSGGGRCVLLTLGDGNVAKDAVVHTTIDKNGGGVVNIGIAVNAETVRVGGLADDAYSASGTCTYTLVSGNPTGHTGADATGFVSDSTVRTLMVMGEGGSTQAKVGANLNLAMNSTGGVQKFTGDLSSFNGSIVVQAGELQLLGSSIHYNDVQVEQGGVLYIGADANADIHAGKTIVNSGSVNLSGRISLTGSLAENDYEVAVPGTTSYSGTGEYEGSGFLTTTSQYYLVKNTDGGALNANVTSTDQNVVITKENNSLLFSNSTQGDIYYVNKDLTYNAELMGNPTKIAITTGHTLSASSAAPVANAVLSGAGTFSLSGMANLGSGVTLDSEGWIGTVKVTGRGDNLDLTGMYTPYSNICLDGWEGYFNGAPTITADVEIGTGGVLIRDGSSSNLITFAGALKGSGNITRANVGSPTIKLKFTGDVKDYTGSIIHNRALDGNVMEITFAGDAKVVNAGLIGIGQEGAGNLNVNFQAEDTVVNSEVSRNATGTFQQHQVNVNVQGNTVFANTVNVNTLSVASGKTATFTAESTIATCSIASGGTTNFNAQSTIGTYTNNGGTVNFNAQSTIGTYTINGGATNFNADATITTLDTNGSSGSASVTIAKNATVNATNIANSWGIGTITVDGTLNVADNFKFSTGNRRNNVVGSGTINTNKLESSNYTNPAAFSGVTLNIGNGGIIGGDKIEFGTMTVGVREGSAGWTASNGNISLVSGATTTFAPGAGQSITMGAIAGAGALEMNGAGTLTLGGNDTYSGGTIVTAGTLVANHANALGSGAVTVNGGMLSLTNSVDIITGTLTVNNGGTLKLAGFGSDAVAADNLTLNSGAILDLSTLSLSAEQSSYVLATGSSVTVDDNVVLTLSDEQYRDKVSLYEEDGTLMLILNLGYKNLVWQGPNGDWSVNPGTKDWYLENTTTAAAFADGDIVRFGSASNDHIATLGTDVRPAQISVDANTSVAVGLNNHTLSSDSVALASNSTLTVNGTDGTFSNSGSLAMESGSTLRIDNAGAEVSLGAVSMKNASMLEVLAAGPVTAQSVFVDDGAGATIKLGADMRIAAGTGQEANSGALYTMGANKTLQIVSADDAVHTLTVDKLDIANHNTGVRLQGVTLNVQGAATVGSIITDRSNDIGIMTVGSGATLNFNGSVDWHKNGTADVVNLIIQDGGSVNVNRGTANTLNGVAVEAGGALHFASGTNTTLYGTVSLAEQVDNAGTLDFGGRAVSVTLTGNDAATVFHIVEAGYTDLSGNEGENGFAHTVMGDIASGNGSIGNAGSVQVTYNGASYTGLNEGGVFGSVDNTTYHVNTGTVEYDAALAGASSITSLALASGATLNLNRELANGVGINASGGTVNIAKGVSLGHASISASAQTTLSGQGRLELANNSIDLPEQVVLGDDWAGVVAVSGVALSGSFTPEKLSNDNSWVEVKGLTGYMSAGANNVYEVSNNLVLVGDSNGWAIQQNNGNNNSIIKFSGTLKGSGNVGRGNGSGSTYTYEFSGDISEWTGSFISNNPNNNSTTFRVSGNATEINAGLINNGTDFRVVVQNGATFNGAIHANSLTVESGSSATFTQAAAFSGTATLKGNTSVSFMAAEGATSAAPTQHTVGGFALSNGDSFDRNITVGENAALNVTGSLTNSWGMGTLRVDGTLQVANELKMSSGGNGSTQNNIITGSGTINAGSLTFVNVGTYNVTDMHELNVAGATSIGTSQKVNVFNSTLNLNGTLNMTNGSLYLGNGSVVTVSGTSGTNALRNLTTASGSALEFGAGTTATISGTGSLAATIANAGNLTLNGTYSLDDFDISKSSSYEEGENNGNGFMVGRVRIQLVSGSGTTQAGESLTLTYLGQTGEFNAADGTFTVPGADEPHYDTFFVNGSQTVESLANAIEKGQGQLDTIQMSGNTTLNAAGVSSTVGTLAIAQNGDSAPATITGGAATFNNMALKGETSAVAVDEGAKLKVNNAVEVATNHTLVTDAAGTFEATTLRSTGGVIELGGNNLVSGGGNAFAITENGGSISITDGTTTVTNAVYTKAQNTTINVGTGGQQATLVATRMELGDSGGGTGTLNIGANGKVVVTGGVNTRGGHKYVSLLLGEWNQTYTTNISGVLLAKDAIAMFSRDNPSQTVNVTGGTMAVLGIATIDANTSKSHNLNVTDGGKLVLGTAGIESDNGNWNIKVQDSEIGMTADTAIGRAMNLVGKVTVNTDKYEFRGSGANQEMVQGDTAGNMTISGAVNGGESATISKVGGGTLTVSGSMENFSGSIEARGGDINLLNQSAGLTVQDVTIAEGTTVSAYVDTEKLPEGEATLTIRNGGSMTAEGRNSKLNANLVMETGSTLDVSGTGGTGLALGSTLTLNPGMNLSQSDFDTVQHLGIGGTYTLFNGVDELTLNGSTPAYVGQTDAITTEARVDAADYYNNLERGQYYLVYNGSNVGQVAIFSTVPEPATSTLSLLALAALAARRRRK